MKSSLFQVAKRHRVQRCLFSLFCLCAAWALPFAASAYTILHDDYGARVGYERTGLSCSVVTVAIRYLDWDESATDKSLAGFVFSNAYGTEMKLGANNAVLGCDTNGSSKDSGALLTLSHEGGLLFVQQTTSGICLFDSTGKQICSFSYSWSGKNVVSLHIGNMLTLQNVVIFDSSLTALEMSSYVNDVVFMADCRWSNFTLKSVASQLESVTLSAINMNFSVTSGVTQCEIPGNACVDIRKVGIPLQPSTTPPSFLVLSQRGGAVTGACECVTDGAKIVFGDADVRPRDLAEACFTDRHVQFDSSETLKASFLDAYKRPMTCMCICAQTNGVGSLNSVLKVGTDVMALVDICVDATNLDSSRPWFRLNGVSVSRAYVDTWLPQADWTTLAGRVAVCAALADPRDAGEASNGYSLLDSWALGLNPTNPASVVRLNLKYDASAALKLGFEGVKTNREAFVRQGFSIKHAATLEGLEGAAYRETGSEMTVPLGELESVQFYRGKISFDPL